MGNIEKELMEFKEEILLFKIPRWEELPDIELYMDQLITYIEKYLSIIEVVKENKIITAAMINNYVKLGLIPKPVNRKYNKSHIAYLFAISILKHVFTIQEIKDGIIFQSNLNGEKKAYNDFCEEQEKAIILLAEQIGLNRNIEDIKLNTIINQDNLAIKMATLSFASKIIAEKVIEIQKDFTLEKEGL